MHLRGCVASKPRWGALWGHPGGQVLHLLCLSGLKYWGLKQNTNNLITSSGAMDINKRVYQNKRYISHTCSNSNLKFTIFDLSRYRKKKKKRKEEKKNILFQYDFIMRYFYNGSNYLKSFSFKIVSFYRCSMCAQYERDEKYKEWRKQKRNSTYKFYYLLATFFWNVINYKFYKFHGKIRNNKKIGL